MTKLTAAQEKVLRQADLLECKNMFFSVMPRQQKTADILVAKGLLEKVETWNFLYRLTIAGNEWLADADYEETDNTPAPSAIVETPVSEAAFEVGQMVQWVTVRNGAFVGEIISTMEFRGKTYYRVAGRTDYFSVRELADASLVYDQPSLPEPSFAIGDHVRVTSRLARKEWGDHGVKTIDSIDWFDGRYWYHLAGQPDSVAWFNNDLALVTIPPALQPTFARAAEREKEALVNNAEAEKLIASFNPIAAEFEQIEADMKTDPLDYFIDYEDKPAQDWESYMGDKFAKDVQ